MSIDDRNILSKLRRMGDDELTQFAQMNQDNPYLFPLAFQESQDREAIRSGSLTNNERGNVPSVKDQALMAMAAPQQQQQAPQQQAPQPAMPQPAMPQQAMPQQAMPQAMPQQAMPQAMPQQAMPQQAMPQPATPPQAPQQQGQTRRAADGGYMDSRLPEEMGIGALPERSLANMADGGIIGYAFGGIPKGSRQPSFDNALEAEGIQDPRQQAFLKALYGKESGSGANTTTSNRGAVGGMQILPGTFDEVADTDMDINNPFDNMRAGIRYGMQGYRAAKGDPVLAGAYYYSGPDGFKDAVNNIARVDTKNPKYPNSLEYGKSIASETAKIMTRLLPMGSAQAAAPAAQAPAAQADLPSIYSGEGYTRAGLDALGERLDIIREARKNAKPPSLKDRQKDPEAPQRYDALVQLNKDAQKEYENYAEKLGLNKPAFAASAGDGKSVGTTTIPFVQQVAKEAARPVSNEPDAYLPSPNETMSFSDQMQEYGRGRKTAEALAEANRPPELKLTPEVKKEAVALAKAEIPKEERSGFGYEDLLMFGLQLMGNKSQYFGTAVGEAGVAALSAKQARTAAEKKTSMEERKIASDEKKEAAMAKYYDKYGSYLEAEGSRKALEDKPQLQYLKAVDAELGKLVAPNNMPYQIASPAEKQRMEQEVRDRVLRTYSAHFPELADTMGGGGFKVLGSRASP